MSHTDPISLQDPANNDWSHLCTIYSMKAAVFKTEISCSHRVLSLFITIKVLPALLLPVFIKNPSIW